MSVFGERFKSARLLKGYSLQDLADILENRVSRQALHRYEKGEVVPSVEMIEVIAKALDLLPDFFYRKVVVDIKDIEFRKQEKLSVKEQTKIKEQTREYLSRYLELEEIVGLSSEFENPFLGDNMDAVGIKADYWAECLREKWNLGNNPIYNVVELLEEKNIKIIKLDADDSFDGLKTTINESIPVIVFNEKNQEKQDRIRFTLLHELGHILFSDYLKDLPEAQKEIICHQFAGAMLMPAKTLQMKLGEHRTKISFAELANIKQQYGISMQALIMRAKDCGIINDNYTRQFFFMIKQLGWKINEPIVYEGREESTRFKQLLFRAFSENLISEEKAASLNNNQSVADFRREYMLS